MDEYTLAGFQLGKLIIAFVVSATLFLIIYIIWTNSSNSSDDQGVESARSQHQLIPGQVVTTLYALELEPGTVVLQSEDGEFFRILKEYQDATVPRRPNAPSHPPDYSPSPSPHQPIFHTRASDRYYQVIEPEYDLDSSTYTDQAPLPSYTRAHYQNSPSQPLLHDGERLQHTSLTSPYDENGKWRPLTTLDFNRR